MEEKPDIADIPQIEKTSQEVTEEEISTAQKLEHTFQTVSQQIQKTVNIDLFLPDI